MKLYPFIDNWIYAFEFTNESKSSVVFHCDKNVNKWGLFWKDVAGGKAIIIPHLAMDSYVHFIIGPSSLELHGIDNETLVLVVEERLPKDKRSITYGLILDLNKLSLELYGSFIEKGYMFFPEYKALWTPQHIQEQWN